MGWWIAVVSAKGNPIPCMEVPSEKEGRKFLEKIPWLSGACRDSGGTVYSVNHKTISDLIRKRGINPMNGLLLDEVYNGIEFAQIKAFTLIETKMFQPVLTWDFKSFDVSACKSSRETCSVGTGSSQ